MTIIDLSLFMNRSHKIKLNPTKKQIEFFKKSCGVKRFVYNWGLDKWKELYEKGEKPSAYSLIKHLNSIKKEQFPWMLDVGKCAPQYALHDLQQAYKNFFDKRGNFPRIKKKKKIDSFRAIENEISFKQENKKIWIPRLGWVRCYEDLRFTGKVNNVTVKRIADMWFAVVNVEIEKPEKALVVSENQVIVGADFGISNMITLSDGVVFENPNFLEKKIKALKREQRKLRRKQSGSKNWEKQKNKYSKKHFKVVDARKNAIHQATTFMIKNYDKIIIEDLAVKEMMKNKNISRKISDVSLYEIRRQLEYKSEWYGKELVIADRFFPSSKLCSNCGNKKDRLSLSQRTYKCAECKTIMDRDLNAAKNLASYSPTHKTGESYASGDLSVCGSLNEELKLKNSLTF